MNHPQFGELISKHRVNIYWSLTKIILLAGFTRLTLFDGDGNIIIPGLKGLQNGDPFGFVVNIVESFPGYIALLFLCISLWRLIRFYCVFVYKDGLVVKSNFGEQSWHWGTFTATSVTLMLRDTYNFIITLNTGELRLYKGEKKVVAFNCDHTHFNELINNITIQIDALLLPQYMKKFELYGEVDFDGKLAINKERVYDIKRPRAACPWKTSTTFSLTITC
ncbi:hypothetical protein G4Y79_19840 [Phototrophicus methaneseepsis]|uniref:Uncharacterized protein n=1 Tax=Phototrophicus methaneseepsis TaxID=2710758 RepID=A0A7S8E7T3_9CHLR|nr:DUF6585 family protein [Phototrophicus methaneseepsis]QPC81917.1 hypothetical protein G4Y79_19840 [Phototrophicus methaneseepsis]